MIAFLVKVRKFIYGFLAWLFLTPILTYSKLNGGVNLTRIDDDKEESQPAVREEDEQTPAYLPQGGEDEEVDLIGIDDDKEESKPAVREENEQTPANLPQGGDLQPTAADLIANDEDKDKSKEEVIGENEQTHANLPGGGEDEAADLITNDADKDKSKEKAREEDEQASADLPQGGEDEAVNLIANDEGKDKSKEEIPENLPHGGEDKIAEIEPDIPPLPVVQGRSRFGGLPPRFEEDLDVLEDWNVPETRAANLSAPIEKFPDDRIFKVLAGDAQKCTKIIPCGHSCGMLKCHSGTCPLFCKKTVTRDMNCGHKNSFYCFRRKQMQSINDPEVCIECKPWG